MKFNKNDKQSMVLFHEMMAYMYQNDISIIYAYGHNTLGGVTIAYKNVFPRSKMTEVAVSYCTAPDKFDKDTGTFFALEKFANGEAVQLPLGHLDPEQQANVLYSMFRMDNK